MSGSGRSVTPSVCRWSQSPPAPNAKRARLPRLPFRLAATLRHKVSRCSLAPFSVIVGQQCAGFIVRLDLLHQTRIGLLNDHEEGWCMSSYATYCQDQATDCTRRARLARSTDIALYYEGLGLRWLRLAEHAQGTGGVVGQASEAIGASSLRTSDLDARHNICASLKKLYQELSPHCFQSQAP
jgi:hypothetical protein